MARRWVVGLLACGALGAVAGPLGAPASPRLGQPAGAVADPGVFPDGRGLPPGQGDAAQGKALYEARCASCHGVGGRGGSGGRLVGREPLAGTPLSFRSVGQFWPYATTLFDYIRRAMPLDRPGTLGADESYALTAYLLHANGVIAEGEAMDARSLPAVRMPNREGFIRAADAPPAPR
jgi:hypothetical protein